MASGLMAAASRPFYQYLCLIGFCLHALYQSLTHIFAIIAVAAAVAIMMAASATIATAAIAQVTQRSQGVTNGASFGCAHCQSNHPPCAIQRHEQNADCACRLLWQRQLPSTKVHWTMQAGGERKL